MVYPNPVRGRATFELEHEGARRFTLQVWNVAGRQIEVRHIDTPVSGKVRFTLGVEGWPSGVYVYRFHSETEVYTGSFVVER